jgi:hypothetical protein
MSARIFTWLPLPHLPKVPDHFVDRILELAVPTTDPDGCLLQKRGTITAEFKHRPIVKAGQQMRSRCQEAFDIGSDWEQWVRENITEHFSETSGRINVGIEGSTVHGAHADGPLYRLFYLLEAGGDDVETVFYWRPDSNFLYSLDKDNNGGYLAYDNMDDLVEVERARFPRHQWILFNGHVLHGVENIQNHRVNINITVRPEHFTFSIANPL